MKKYDDNIPLLKNRVETHAFIRNISKHRLPDGTLDVEGNLKLWNDGMQGFVKTPLWEKTPGWREDTHLQGEPYLVFVPGNPGSPTILIAHGGGFSWRTGCEGPNVAWYFHQAGYNTAILSYRLLPYDRYASMADMQRAIRLLRARKEEFGIGEKIVVMGFSAGGMICGNCATHFDNGSQTAPDLVQQMSSRPDACVIGYGAMSEVSFPQPFMMEQPEHSLFGDTVRVVKLTENIKTGLSLHSFDVDGEILMPVVEPIKKRIEFVGDSITCGFGLGTSEKDRFYYPQEENVWMAHGPTAARCLGMDWQMICISGICLAPRKEIPMPVAMNMLYEYTDRPAQQALELDADHWNFKEHPVDYVVINLGTNDATAASFSAAPKKIEEQYEKDYVHFLKTVRKCNGDKTKIICALGSMDYYFYDAMNRAVDDYFLLGTL